jgi:hypothetical protein
MGARQSPQHNFFSTAYRAMTMQSISTLIDNKLDALTQDFKAQPVLEHP